MQQAAVALSTSGSRGARPNEGPTTFHPPRKLWYPRVRGGGHIREPRLPSLWSVRPRSSSARKPRALRRPASCCASRASLSPASCVPYKNSELVPACPRPNRNEHLLAAAPTARDNSPAPQSLPPSNPRQSPTFAPEVSQNNQPQSDLITGDKTLTCRCSLWLGSVIP